MFNGLFILYLGIVINQTKIDMRFDYQKIMTEKELDSINEDSDFVYEQVQSFLF